MEKQPFNRISLPKGSMLGTKAEVFPQEGLLGREAEDMHLFSVLEWVSRLTSLTSVCCHRNTGGDTHFALWLHNRKQAFIFLLLLDTVGEQGLLWKEKKHLVWVQSEQFTKVEIKWITTYGRKMRFSGVGFSPTL